MTQVSKGGTYRYAWRGGPRILSEYGTQAFADEFYALRSPHSNFDRSKFGTWVSLYRLHEGKDGCGGKKAYPDLSEKTKANWGPLLGSIQERFGNLSVRQFARPTIRTDIRAWRRQWADTPRMADMAMQVLSRVCSFMVAQGVIATNPCKGVESLYSHDRSDKIWPDEYLEKIYAIASPEISWAAELDTLTGLRQDDLLTLEWTEMNDLYIEKPTHKSGFKKRALIPIDDKLRALLARIPKRAKTVLTNTRGKPWATGFHSSWDDAVDRAGLADAGLTFHDLRGTAATNFYRAGFSYAEIAETMGVSQDQVESWIRIYVKRDELMRDRIRRLEHFRKEQDRLREHAGTELYKTGNKTGDVKFG